MTNIVGKIRPIQDKDGNYVFPKTCSDAVIMKNGMSLDESLGATIFVGEDKGLVEIQKPEQVARLDQAINDISNINEQLDTIAIQSSGYILNDNSIESINHNNNIINLMISEANENSFVRIPSGVAWDYRGVNHKDNIIIWDSSNYDFYVGKWSGTEKIILKTDNPSTKNANTYNIIGNHHPNIRITNIDSNGRASVVLDNYGDGIHSTVLLSADNYNGKKIFAIKDKNFSSTYQVLVDENANSETAFNTVASVGVSYKFKSKVNGEMINEIISNSNNDNIVNKFILGDSEKIREVIDNYGNYQIQQRGQSNRGFGFDSNGTINFGYYQQKIYTDTDPSTTTNTYKRGDLYINVSASNGRPIGKICTVGGAPGTWVDFGQSGYRTVNGSPVGNTVPLYVGEEILDNTNFIWYKSHGTASGHWKAIT